MKASGPVAAGTGDLVDGQQGQEGGGRQGAAVVILGGLLLRINIMLAFPFSDFSMQLIHYISDHLRIHFTLSLGLIITNCVFLNVILM